AACVPVVTDAVWKATTGRMASDSAVELATGPSGRTECESNREGVPRTDGDVPPTASRQAKIGGTVARTTRRARDVTLIRRSTLSLPTRRFCPHRVAGWVT